MQAPAEELQVVPEGEDHPDDDEDPEVRAHDEHADDPQRHSPAQADKGRSDQLRGGDRRAEWSAVDLVEGVRADADGEKEGAECRH